jgi:hypothetical protein
MPKKLKTQKMPLKLRLPRAHQHNQEVSNDWH